MICLRIACFLFSGESPPPRPPKPNLLKTLLLFSERTHNTHPLVSELSDCMAE